MKRKTCTILATLALLATVLTSVAAQSDRLIAANVPFNFVISGRALPAGEYVFALVKLGGSDAIKVQSADGHITAFALTGTGKALARWAEAKLVFNRYDDQYFLSLVYGLEQSAPQQLCRSRAEELFLKSQKEKSDVSIAVRRK